MKPRRRSRRYFRQRGRSAIEILVVLGTIVTVSVFGFVVISRTLAAARSTSCLNNLRQFAAALHGYASDHGGAFPDPLATGSTWESVVSPSLRSPEMFRCPADAEVYPAIGSSYDWRDTSDPLTTVVGRSILACRPDAVLVFDALPNWHRAASINVARIDGAAFSVSEKAWAQDLRRPIAVGAPTGTAAPSPPPPPSPGP